MPESPPSSPKPVSRPAPSVLRPWTVIGLTLAGAVVALGAAVGGDTRPHSGTAWIGTPLIALGACGAAVCITLWVVDLFSNNRRATPALSPRIRTLAADLLAAAKLADSRGILSLSTCSMSSRADLFQTGAKMLVTGDSCEAIRAKLASMTGSTPEQNLRRSRLRQVCTILPLGALAVAFTVVLWAFVAAATGASMGTLLPLGLLAAVYGSFIVSVLAVEIADRALGHVSEEELASTLVIETLVGIRSGETADRLAARLGLASPDPAAKADAAPASPLRRAA